MLHLSKIVIFCGFILAYRDQGRRPCEVIVFFLYRFNIYMQGESFQLRLVCKVHIPCFAVDRGLI